MDDFARLPTADRADLFRTVALRRSMNQAIIVKDFWVCWILKRLFTDMAPPPGLLFKGGTSLSKVFHVIERFSEDIDLSFNRDDLGFGGDEDPAAAPTAKGRSRRLKALSESCQQVIHEQFLPALKRSCGYALANEPGNGWNIELADDDPDQQTLVFQYPTSIQPSAPANEPMYIQPAVRLEIGARSDHWPATDATVAPYAADEFPHLFQVPACRVHVLSAERTFWEKATILHAWHHAPPEKALRDRQSRHYYDVVRMYEHGIGREAMKDLNLLLKVAEHKDIFFASAWAKYREARPGTLRLVPPTARLGELRRDYQSMREMIFGAVPAFDHLLGVLQEIETAVNADAQPDGRPAG